MKYEMMVGLHVKNDLEYQEYRKAMAPLLERYEGGFRYDFKVSEVLKNEEGRPINRVFAIYFGSKDQMKAFFENPRYLTIKKQYFESSVAATTVIAEYER